MGIKTTPSRTNNQILPQNNRTTTIAQRMIGQLAAYQQRKNDNAIQTNGYEVILYKRLAHGIPCSCQAHRSVLTSQLGEDGKLPIGKINELLTGGMEFTVTPYAERVPPREDLRGVRNIPEPIQPDQQWGEVDDEDVLVFDNASPDITDTYAKDIETSISDSANGPGTAVSLDDITEQFDNIDLSDSRCMICLGTGFVGGYSPVGAWRQCLSTQWANISVLNGTVEANQVPHAFFATQVDFNVVMPSGCVNIDTIRLWNNMDVVAPQTLLVDQVPYSWDVLRSVCDGRSHTISVQFDELTYFTHLELQINLTNNPIRVDIPKLAQSADGAKLDKTNSVQLVCSSRVPVLQARDVIIESVFGKAFSVEDVTPWSDRNRNFYGWECNAHVVQPEEWANVLPRRHRTAQQSSNPARSNAVPPESA